MRDDKEDVVTVQTTGPLTMATVVDLVNGWSDAAREDRGDPYPDLGPLRASDPHLAAMATPDLATLVSAANRLYEVFASDSGAECAGVVNTLLAETGLVPAVRFDGWQLQETCEVPRADRALLAWAALGVLVHLRSEPDASRLGVCAADDCSDVYADTSPSGKRQYCSVTCQNRQRARSYRAGRRAQEDARTAAHRAAAEARVVLERAKAEARTAARRAPAAAGAVATDAIEQALKALDEALRPPR